MRGYVKNILIFVVSVFILMTSTYAYTITIKERDMTVRYSKTSGKKVFLTSNVGENITGWRVVSGNITIENNSFIMPKEDVVIEPIYKTFTVSYDANGGEGAPEAQTKTYGIPLTLSGTTPTRSNYTFLGWAANNTATVAEYQAGGSFTTDATTTLYAVWKSNTYTITATAGANGTITPNGVVTKEGGTSQGYTITPDSGYVVASVKVDNVDQGRINTYTFTNISANHTIEVVFGKEYNLKVQMGTDEVYIVAPEVSGGIVNINAITQVGKSFTNWEADGVTLTQDQKTSKTLTFTMPESNVTLIGKYTAYKVRVESEEVYIYTEQTAGTEVGAEVNDLYGRTFDTWISSGVNLSNTEVENIEYIMPENDVTQKATYKQTYNSNITAGEIIMKVETESGSNVHIEVSDTAGKSFRNWVIEGITIENPSGLTLDYIMPQNGVTQTIQYND